MPGEILLAAPDERQAGRYPVRVLHAFDRRRLAAVGLVTLSLSIGPLVSAGLHDFFSPLEVAFAWLEHLLELLVIAAALMVVYTLLDEALPRRLGLRLGIVCLALACASMVLTLLLYAYYARGFVHLPPLLRLLADSLRWGLPAALLAVIADVHRHAMQIDAAAQAAETTGSRCRRDEGEQQLALLQAQIEPHFLFNVLGNVRRLYRTCPEAGAAAVGSLMRYLRTTLPQVRSQRGCLGDELELVRSYLALFQVRMGQRLTFSIDADAALHAAEFPPMLLVTLVENAIKHGLEPAGGGHVDVVARRCPGGLEVAVLDDGVGFGGAPSGGTGVGLANVRRQLAARYQDQGRLTLAARQTRGASATIAVPWRPAGDTPASAAEPASGGTAVAGARSALPPQAGNQTTAPITFIRWLRRHRGAIAMAGLLAFSPPLTFLIGSLSVMREPTSADWAILGFWWLLFAIGLWCLLLLAGYGALRLLSQCGSLTAVPIWIGGAVLVAACVSLATASGRADILIEQGVVQSVQTLRLNSFILALTPALLFFAHLQRSQRHEQAVLRLAAAQAGQRAADQRIVQARLQALQARTDPQLLFEMLDVVRRSYGIDPTRAERLLDELASFLRSALPRLRSESSTVPREIGLAQHYVQLRRMAGEALDTGPSHSPALAADISDEALHARFPPGVLLPLLDSVLRTSGGAARLSARRAANDCVLVLNLPLPLDDAVVVRVRELLASVYGRLADLAIEASGGRVVAAVRVPYEFA